MRKWVALAGAVAMVTACQPTGQDKGIVTPGRTPGIFGVRVDDAHISKNGTDVSAHGSWFSEIGHAEGTKATVTVWLEVLTSKPGQPEAWKVAATASGDVTWVPEGKKMPSVNRVNVRALCKGQEMTTWRSHAKAGLPGIPDTGAEQTGTRRTIPCGWGT